MMHFFGFSKPFLRQFTELLLEKYSSGNILNLSDLIICLPGQKSIRRLQEIIFETNPEISIILPSFCTPGELAEHLLGVRDFTLRKYQRINVWIKALNNLSGEDLSLLISNQNKDYSAFLEMAKKLDRIYLELSGARKDFKDLLDVVSTKLSDDNLADWIILDKVLGEYKEQLKNHDLIDQHQYRLIGKVHQKKVLLAGCIDLNQITKDILENVDDLEVYVNSDEINQAGFDKFGCFVPDFWRTFKIENLDYKILSDEYMYPKYLISELENYSGDNQNLTIFNCNEALNGFIVEQAGLADVNLRANQGTSASSSSFGILISSVIRFYQEDTFSELGELIRHPIILNKLEKLGFILKEWDRKQDLHIQLKVNDASLELFKLAVNNSQSFFEDLISIDNNQESIIENIEKLEKIIGKISELDQNHGELFQGAISNLGDLIGEDKISFYDFLQLFSAILSEVSQDPEQKENSIDLLGWLEMPLDDAEYAFLLACNDQYIPGDTNQDFYIPNSIRGSLGLPDSEYKLARDIALLSAKNHSSKLKIAFSKKTMQGDPLLPSRILFAVQDPDLLELLKSFTSIDQIYTYHAKKEFDLNINKSGYDLSANLPPISKLSITSFKELLNNPLRFYFQKLQGLEELDDQKEELDSRDIGNILHTILESIVRAEIENPKINLKEVAFSITQNHLNNLFKSNVNNNVFLQHDILYRHINSWLEWQIDWRKGGNTTIELEKKISFPISVENGVVQVTGRIDRIDFNPVTKEYYIIDYKFKDSETSKVFYKEQWYDLQLPLYWMYAKSEFGEQEIYPFHVKLGKENSKVTPLPNEYTSDKLQLGVDQVKEICRQLLTGYPLKLEKVRELDWFGYIYNSVSLQ